MRRMHPIEGTAWRLVRGVDIPAGIEITARFVGGTVSGHAGINRYRADYRLHGDVLELGPAATTLMAGDPAGDARRARLPATPRHGR